MGLGGQSLNLIRSVFKQAQVERPPYVPPVGYQTFTSTQAYSGFGQINSVQGLYDQLRVDSELVSRFVDYEDMDDNALCSSAFDIFSEDASQLDSEEHKTVWVRCEDGEIQKELEELLHRRLKIEGRVYQDIRTVVKYGNLYAEIVAKDGAGVVALNTLPAPTVRRMEIPKEIGQHALSRADLDIDTLGYVYDPRGVFNLSTAEFLRELERRSLGDYSVTAEQQQSQVVVMESWEVMHVKLSGKQALSPYGFGVGEPARWIFKRLLMLEDAVLMHRLTRSPSKYAFYIDVSQIPPAETQGYLNRVKQALKKQKFVNPNNNKMDLKFDPWCLSLDTPIDLISGESKKLSEMIADFELGKENLVYSIHPKTLKVVPGKVVWAGVTKREASMVRVHLSDGSKFEVTPEHKFMLVDGSYCEAVSLKPGEELMSLHGLAKKTGEKMIRQDFKDWRGNRHHLMAFLRDQGINPLRSKKKFKKHAHTVVKVQVMKKKQDVGCITVEHWHNFSIGQSVFVKNSQADDFFLPVRDGKESTRVESLQGPVYDHIEDVRFFEDKLFAAFKIPKPFLTYEQTTAKTHLSAEDARFARSVMRIQREYIEGIKKVCKVHLAARGINPEAIDFDIKMTIPSAIFELSQLEIRNAELELAEKFGAWAPKNWIMTHVLGFSDDEILEMERLKQIEQNAGEETPKASAMGGIERATSKRGTPAMDIPSRGGGDREPPGGGMGSGTPGGIETASRYFSRSKLLTAGKDISNAALLERIDELRDRNKQFDRHFSESLGLLRELQGRMKR